jgi:hypothetical protein
MQTISCVFSKESQKLQSNRKADIRVLELVPGILALIAAVATVPAPAATVVTVVLVTASVIICESEANETGSSNAEQCGTRIDDLLGSAIGIIRRGAAGAGGKDKGNGDGTNQ